MSASPRDLSTAMAAGARMRGGLACSMGLAWLICFLACQAPSQITAVVDWGINFVGQQNVPASLTNAIAVGVNGYSLVALRADGSVAEWGNGAGDPGVSNLVSIHPGWSHALGLRADGTIVGWGDNALGEATPPPDLTNAIGLAASYYFSYAVRPDGTVRGWGDNPSGVLNAPAGLSNVVAISAGGYHVMALSADGTVVEWGEWTAPGGLSNVVAIAAGDSVDAVLLADHTVVTWPIYTADPAALTNVFALAAGASHGLTLHYDGTISGWGCDCGGAITVPNGLSNVTAIAAGGSDGYDLSVALMNWPLPPPPTLSIALNDGVARISFSGSSGHQYVLEESTDLGPHASWTFRQNILATASSQPVLALAPPGASPSKFYRARLIR